MTHSYKDCQTIGRKIKNTRERANKCQIHKQSKLTVSLVILTSTCIKVDFLYF